MKCVTHLLWEKLQKLLSVNTETKRHLGYQIWHHLHKYALKGRFLVMTPFRGAKFDGVRYAT